MKKLYVSTCGWQMNGKDSKKVVGSYARLEVK